MLCISFLLPACVASTPLYLYTCLVHHLHLPAFPTRRSSDLISIRCRGFRYCRVRDTRAPWPTHSGCPSELRRRTGFSSFPDRKSTRLNSSHRCISYAVFCLKKKTKKNT